MNASPADAGNPLAALGHMPGLPGGWDALAVVQPSPTKQRLDAGERWPLTFYPVVTVGDINRALGWGV